MRVDPARAAPLVSGLFRCLGSTWRLTRLGPGELEPDRTDRSRRFVYALWHRNILGGCFAYRKSGACMGVSEHADGELAAHIAARWGYETARGSSTRAGTQLVRQMLRFASAPGGV